MMDLGVARVLTRNVLHDALDRLGICEGDLVIVKADLAYLGPLEGADSKDAYVQAMYEVLRDHVGSSGTLVVPTTSTRLCASGEDFLLEQTPSEMGMLSECIRRRPRTRRSLHPFGSYAAEGPLASAIVDDVAKSSYGPDTPKARLIEFGAKVLNIGIPPYRTNSVVHHAEQLMGVPYRYHKEFSNRVFVGGRYVGTDYLMYVRRLECGVALDASKERRLFHLFHQRGQTIAEVQVSSAGRLMCLDLRAMFDACVALLKQDIYGLLAKPPEDRPYRL